MIVNNDKNVFKNVHENSAETIIKSVNAINPNKATLFVSSSSGCPLKCKFCHLTIKGKPFSSMHSRQIFLNNIKTYGEVLRDYPDILVDKQIKLSLMGMGDAFVDGQSFDASIKTYKYLKENGKFVDKIDVSTVLPRNVDLEMVKNIYSDNFVRKNVRTFYSLFSAIESTREEMIPNTLSPYVAMSIFQKVKIPLILHQLFIENVNDSDEEIDALVNFVNRQVGFVTQLRILRYNECENSWWYESDRFEEIVEILKDKIHNNIELKFQVSPGKEIKAACGMFE